MNLNNLPTLPDGAKWAPHAKAVQAFDPSLTSPVGDGTIRILGEIGETWDGSGVTPQHVEDELRAIGDRPVTCVINSPGGNFFDGLAIYNLLRAHTQPVTAKVVGVAASAASIVAMAASDIQIAKAGLYMVHNTQWVAIGDKQVMLEVHDHMKVFDDLVISLYAERTGLNELTVAAMMDAETFIGGDAAVEQGFADGLLAADQVVREPVTNISARRRVVAALTAGEKVSRSNALRLADECAADTPSAVAAPVKLSADQDEVDGLNHLRLARMKLSLIRS